MYQDTYQLNEHVEIHRKEDGIKGWEVIVDGELDETFYDYQHDNVIDAREAAIEYAETI